LISFTGLDSGGSAHHGKGRCHDEAVVPRTRGKSANIVLDDADFGSALMGGLAVCFHAGQGCGIPTRMLVPRSRYNEAAERLVEVLKMAPYGDPQRHDVMMGPLVSAKQRDRVLGYIDKVFRKGEAGPGWSSAATVFEGLLRRADVVHQRRQPDDDRAVKRSSVRCWS